MRFSIRSAVSFPTIFLSVFLLGGCNLSPSPQQGQGNPVAQTQQGIQVGLNIYDPNKPQQQATNQNNMKVAVLSPDLSKPLSSPLTVRGKVSGLFFSEGVFPLVLEDTRGKEIARTLAHADGEWMTEDPVAFTAELTFVTPSDTSARLVFEKDNPSGLPENDQSQSFVVTLQ